MYLIFAGDVYYPAGGANDYMGHVEGFAEAMKLAEQHVEVAKRDWAHVFDLETRLIVYTYNAIAKGKVCKLNTRRP